MIVCINESNEVIEYLSIICYSHSSGNRVATKNKVFVPLKLTL